MSETVLNRETVLGAIADLEHPEIAATLIDLGMIGDVVYEADANKLHITLVLPMLNIPDQVKSLIAGGIYERVQEYGAEVVFYQQEMTEDARQAFFAAAKAGWKL